MIEPLVVNLDPTINVPPSPFAALPEVTEWNKRALLERMSNMRERIMLMAIGDALLRAQHLAPFTPLEERALRPLFRAFFEATGAAFDAVKWSL